MTSLLQRDYRARCRIGHDIQKQMPVLYAWARHARKIIELGTRGGNSASAFLAGLEHSGGELWSVDIDMSHVPALFRDLPQWHRIEAPSESAEAIGFCPDDADILFIDTSHLYEHTLAELRYYVPKVKPGGVVFLHDTAQETLQKGDLPSGSFTWGIGAEAALTHDAMRHDYPKVSEALDTYCEMTGLTWYDHPGWNGLGVIEIPDA